MNIKRWYRDWYRNWYRNQGILKKLACMYLVCAALPMVLATAYNYFQTRNLLIKQAYSDVRQNAVAAESSLNTAFGPYKTIMLTIKNDRLINTQLSIDYTNLSYSDIAYYSNHTLNDILVMYPLLSWLRFYSSNDTLPNDSHYFFRLESLGEDAMEIADNAEGISVVAEFAAQEEDRIMLVSRMNYYASESVRNYLALGIQRAMVEEQLYQEEDSHKLYLVSHSGNVLASSDSGMAAGPFRDILAAWEEMPEGEIQTRKDAAGTQMICLKVSLDMGMSLIMTVDRRILLQEAGKLPKQALAVFSLISLAAFLLALAYSRSQAGQLKKIIDATKKIGEGDFGDKLEDMGEDELGQIADAVNQMSGKISSLIQENYERRLMLKTSEMNLLQEQINPHFLYNALAAISSVSLREGAGQTMKSVRHLADFYRMSLSKGRQVITVREEVELLRNYMEIQALRFSDSLEIRYEIEKEAASCNTLKLILQPLVENAIRHGRREEGCLHVKVKAGCRDGRVYYEVTDDGVGIRPQKLEELREKLAKSEEGFGLKNVDIRIKLNYGEDYGVAVSSVYGEGTQVRVEIPC